VASDEAAGDAGSGTDAGRQDQDDAEELETRRGPRQRGGSRSTGAPRTKRKKRDSNQGSRKAASENSAGTGTAKCKALRREPSAAVLERPLLGAPGGGKLLYVVQFGNNSPLVRQVMRLRPGWASGPGDAGCLVGKVSHKEKRVKVAVHEDTPEIQFLWTQYMHLEFLEAMASQQAGLCVALNDEFKLLLKHKKPPVADTGETHAEEAQHATVQRPVPRVHNHYEGSGAICTKRGLRDTMVKYYLRRGRDPFGAVPLTYVIRKGSHDEEYAEWLRAFKLVEAEYGQSVWLVKPAEWANQGCGIRIHSTVEDITTHLDSKVKTWVVQKYIERPLLLRERKFDIRAYCLIVQEPGGGTVRAFAYRQAYLRTTSAKYTTETFDRLVHLNNDAVQKHGEDYGKFESANKLSLEDFQRYLNEHHMRDNISVNEQIVPQMFGLMADVVHAAVGVLNPRKIDHCFELLGFDFMVDADYRVWLIEVNANPCLELCCNYLSRLIPAMLDEALRIALDSVWPQAAAKQSGEGPCGWTQIFSGHASDAESGEVHSTWVPRFPNGRDAADADFSCLGRDLLAPSSTFKTALSAMQATAPPSPESRRSGVRRRSQREPCTTAASSGHHSRRV